MQLSPWLCNSTYNTVGVTQVLPGILAVYAGVLWHEWLYVCDELTHHNVVVFEKCTIDSSSIVINQSRTARTAWLEEVQSKQLHLRFSGSRSYKLFAANYWQFSTWLKEIKTVSSTIINQGSEYESKQDVSSGNVDCEQSKWVFLL